LDVSVTRRRTPRFSEFNGCLSAFPAAAAGGEIAHRAKPYDAGMRVAEIVAKRPALAF
jgi:hypothetical protein